MAARQQPTSRRSLGYRDATLTDPRGNVLAYVDRLALRGAASGGGTVGFSRATFAPSVLERAGRAGFPRVRVSSGGVARVTIGGLRLTVHAGAQPLPEGGWYCDAAVGTFRSLTQGRELDSRRTRRRRR